MKLNIIFLTILISLLVDSALAGGRIYGGEKVDIMDAPYMASVVIVLKRNPDGSSATYDCGGSILRKNLILTAGHCTYNSTSGKFYTPDQYFVNVGSNNIISGGILHSVKQLYTHPDYKGGNDNHFFHDIGLLELNDDITLNEKSQLVQLAHCHDEGKSGTIGVVSGWGTHPDYSADNELYHVNLTVISSESCHEQLAGGTVEEIEKHQICGEDPGKNFCQGDSGGPFIDITTNHQIGIVSYGATDCTLAKPSIFTRVTDNTDFINKIITQTKRRPVNTPLIRPANSVMDIIIPSISNGFNPRN